MGGGWRGGGGGEGELMVGTWCCSFELTLPVLSVVLPLHPICQTISGVVMGNDYQNNLECSP